MCLHLGRLDQIVASRVVQMCDHKHLHPDTEKFQILVNDCQ
jgi:hypothetical protein